MTIGGRFGILVPQTQKKTQKLQNSFKNSESALTSYSGILFQFYFFYTSFLPRSFYVQSFMAIGVPFGILVTQTLKKDPKIIKEFPKQWICYDSVLRGHFSVLFFSTSQFLLFHATCKFLRLSESVSRFHHLKSKKNDSKITSKIFKTVKVL